EALCDLHNADALGTRRSMPLFRLLAARKLRRVFVARRGAKIVAYAGVSGSSVQEYAGPAEEVAALLRAAFERLDDTRQSTSARPPGQRSTIEMSVLTPAAREGLPGLLTELGIPAARGYLGMIRIVDPPGLLRALGMEEVEIEPRDGGWSLRHHG